MNSRELVKSIFNKKNTGKPAFWIGMPKDETFEMYLDKINTTNDADGREELASYLDDDCRWVMASENTYYHPDGLPVFDFTGGVLKTHHGQAGVFAECTDIAEVEAFNWPEVKYLDFTEKLKQIDSLQDKGIFTGMWCPFFHDVADFFGMENYFVKMYTDPDVVEAVTEHVVDYYIESNKIFFDLLGDRADTMFFGNDFGTQLDMLISPDKFDEFVLPSFKKLINIGKKYDKKILLHSCGAISRVIPRLIDAGIDGLHPLQALARNMEAEKLGRDFKDDICFVGGIDTQELLVHGKPEDIREDVLRIREAFGQNLIVSPSHEAILPNVPFENVVAMAKAAKE